MSATAAARVAKGARLLDEVLPGWAVRIDVVRLDTLAVRACVLGQLWGYRGGLMALGLSHSASDEVDYGFEVGESVRDDRRRAAYDRLTECWRAEIGKRT